MNKKPFDIRRACYAMAMGSNSDEAEIVMYGEIVESQPLDYHGDPIDGSYIIQKDFLDDLNDVVRSGAKKLKIRMDSLGGDAGVSILIHNRLRELAGEGIHITCIVDGVAMSGGSLIMCAADTVIVNPSSLVMIHKCWSFIWGGYNADELRAMAKQNDAWDQAQINIYNRKTGLSETVISHMMSDTTYMTGKEALEKGFADEITEEEVPIAASADRRSFIVKGHQASLAHGMKVPENIPTVSAAPSVDINKKQPDPDTGSNEGGNPMATNLEELRAENAQLASQIESEVRAAVSAESAGAIEQATEAERKRISEIDEIARLYDEETVREAKYGDHPCSAQEMAFRAASKAAKSGGAFMANAKADSDASNTAQVGASAAPDEGNKSEDVKADAKAAVASYKKIKEAK